MDDLEWKTLLEMDDLGGKPISEAPRFFATSMIMGERTIANPPSIHSSSSRVVEAPPAHTWEETSSTLTFKMRS